MEKQRIAMVLEFDGGQFHGWQRQENAETVQGTLEKALAGIEGDSVSVVAAGRTDAGVHAEALLVHADVSQKRWQRSKRAYTQGINQQLPDGVRVIGVRAVTDTFHARFDCTERRYRYRIWNRTTASALHQWRHWWMPRAINEDTMREAAACLIGRHDFTSFRAAGCQAANAMREIRYISIERHGWECAIEIHADAFLYHMVRNIVGSLVMVGTERWDAEMMHRVLQARNRSIAAATAPAHGLYFTDAVYSEFSSANLIGKEIG